MVNNTSPNMQEPLQNSGSWLDTALGYLQDNKSNIGLLTGIAGMTGLLDNFTGAKNTGPRGYQGSIPNYTATRSRVPSTYDPTRRPGSGGQRYFTDTQFVPKVEAPATPMSAEGLAALNLANPAQQRMPQTRTQEMASASAATPAPASGVATLNPVPTYTMASEFPAPVEDLESLTGFSNGGGVPEIMRRSDSFGGVDLVNFPELYSSDRSLKEKALRTAFDPRVVGGGLGLGFLEAGRQSGISPLDNSKTFLGKERPYTPDYEGRKPALSEDKMKAYKNIGGKALRQIASKLGVPLALLIPDDLGDGTMPENFNPEFTKNMSGGGLAGFSNGREVSINLDDLDTTAAGARQMGTAQDYTKYQELIERKQDAYFNKPDEERSIKELQEILTMKNMLKSGFYGAMGNRFGDEDKFYKGMEEQADTQAQYFRGMAAGGLAGLAKGRYLRSPSDGMADKIPATIDKTQPAALSGGEYVIPADVVSHLGNGNSDAGAKVLDKMMERIRKTRTGNGKQGKEIDPNKLLPA